GAAARDLPLDAQQRVLVRGDAHAPGACVLDAHDLHRIEVLVTRAEWAGPGRLRSCPAAPGREVPGALGGDDHPPPEDGVSSQFPHVVLAPSPGSRAPLLARHGVRHHRMCGARAGPDFSDEAVRCGSRTPMLYGAGSLASLTDRSGPPPTFSFVGA